jgi:hypothetical protein
LMMEGRVGIPAFRMAITKGEDAASPDLRLRRSSFDLTKNKI